MWRWALAPRIDSGLKLEGDYFEVDYADFVTWRTVCDSDEPVVNCFATAALRGALCRRSGSAGVDPKATFPLGARYGRNAHMSGPSVVIGRPGLAFVQRTGDGSIIEFRNVVDTVRCAIEVQNGMIERNAGVPETGGSNSASRFTSATSSRRATAI
jgi:class 3 adenylate cyclase